MLDLIKEHNIKQNMLKMFWKPMSIKQDVFNQYFLSLTETERKILETNLRIQLKLEGL